MRACIEKSTGKLIEGTATSTPDVLVRNAVAMGYAAAAVEVREVTPAEYRALLDAANANLPPIQVEMWKARVVMKSTPWPGRFGGVGKTMFAAVQAAIAAMPDATKRMIAAEGLAGSRQLTRDGGNARMIRQALEMSEDQFDALLIQAADVPP